jgi:hypothetical protein
MRPAKRIRSAEALNHPRAENIVHELSRAASRIGSGLCNASSRSGSLVSHRYGGIVDELGTTGGSIFSLDVTTDVSDGGAVLNREDACMPLSLPVEGLY